MISVKALMLVGAALFAVGLSAPEWDSGFGRSLLAVGDQDEDGIDELLIVDTTQRDGAPAKFFVWSPGADRCLRSFDHGTWMGEEADSVIAVKGFEGADAVYVGHDIEAQGKEIYLVLFSTIDGAELRRLRLDNFRHTWTPAQLWNLGDVDGKPGDEVLVSYSSRTEGSEGNCWSEEGVIVSLESGAFLRVEHGDWYDAISDTNGDGVREYLVARDGQVGFYCGASGELLFTIEPKLEGHPLMGSFEYQEAGDLNGDGTRDFLEFMEGGETDEHDFYSETRLRSGVNGELLWISERISCTGYTASKAVEVDDHNDDGTPDFVVSNALGVNGWTGCPDWRILSGSSGEVLARFEWSQGGDMWARGTSLALMSDLDGDGYRDVALSNTKARHQGYGDGRVDLYSTKKGLIRMIRLAHMVVAEEEK